MQNFLKIFTTFLYVSFAVGNLLNEKIDWTNVHPATLYQKAVEAGPRIAHGRIEGGVSVDKNHKSLFKFFVRIVSRDYYSVQMNSCGGSLISPFLVLTAAHCLKNFENNVYFEAAESLMYFGITDASEVESQDTVKRLSSNYRIYPMWSPFKSEPGIYHDIAMIILPVPIIPNEQIFPIELPTDKYVDVYEEQEVLIAGWGLENNEQIPTGLKVARVFVQKMQTCSRFWDRLFDPQSMICAIGKKNEGTCRGDSGGPIFTMGPNNKQTLIGLTSYGDANGCVSAIPRAYTAFPNKYLHWINSIKRIHI